MQFQSQPHFETCHDGKFFRTDDPIFTELMVANIDTNQFNLSLSKLNDNMQEFASKMNLG